MPFTNAALRAEIHEWIKKDGSKVGRITSTTPLALNMHLVEVVWEGVQDMAEKPTIVYVCNTTLEAELLDRQLKDRSFHGGKIGEQSFVSKEGQVLGGVVLLSYARFRQLLDAEARAPFFPCRLVVICEQEPGRNMDGVVARGQFTLLARKALVRRPGYNVKLLGLSYRQDRGQDWLKHAVHVMSTLPLRLSLDQTVSYEPGRREPAPEEYYHGEKIMYKITNDAAVVLKGSQHVVVYGSPDELVQFGILVEEALNLGQRFRVHEWFASGIERDPGLDPETEMVLGPMNARKPGSLVLIAPGCFSTPLPFTNAGMVISMIKSIPRRIYDNGLHLVTSSRRGQSSRSLISQRWTGRASYGRDTSRVACVVEIHNQDCNLPLPTTDIHLQNGTHDPLRECFAMVAAYPGTALNLLPIFEGVDEPLDLVVRLRAMGLLVNQGDGFVLTNKGKRAKAFMDEEMSLTLEAATALVSADVERMGEKVARSILRLSFMKDMSDSFVRSCPMELENDAEFVSFLRNFAVDSVQGGPGRERIDRGLMWLIWVSFESVSREMDVNGASLPGRMRPSNKCPLYFEIDKLREAIGTLATWERLLGLSPIQNGQREDWNTPLTPDEVTIVEHEIARANYSTILAIPFPAKRNGQVEQGTLPTLWVRTNEPAEIQGEFDKYLHATRRAMTEDVQLSAPHRHILFGGLPLSISTDETGRTSVTGLMWFPYDVIKALMGDLQAEDADPWVRAVAMLQ